MEPSPVTVHLLARPGDSLLLQHTLDRLLKWVSPDLRLFHVSERAAPLSAPPSGPAGYPALTITLFLHEALGEERILHVLDFLQRTPWRYHHTESCVSRGAAGVHVPANALLRPYLLPSRDFYSLGAGMPVWGVRPVHCGAEVVRVTLHGSHDNYDDTVRLYEMVLQRRAEEQKAGFCWFTLAVGRGLSLQLALKQLAPGMRVEPCPSAVLQFRAAEMGQLVPLLPNPCSPISATRWQTEDLDGNKILFQVKGAAPPSQPLTPAFTTPSSRLRLQSPPTRGERSEGERLGSDGCCSPPHSSSCHSSQRSSPAPSAPLSHASGHSSLSLLLPRGDEPETNVDTGCTVLTPRPARLPTEGDSALETLSWELSACLPAPPPTYAERSHAPNTPDHTHRTPPDEFFI
ncbi:protein FAM124B-like isoform X2 [Denticeps clupeoides]|uniref:protein FAM124B-like isoform X2 n=1 Tax=Denticeps clupeoides TaxID=299321 RepID=UPI0010A3F6B2|nr:protein FAM124B-like isoform X2 [Denticeps clupeoides]